MCRKHVKVEPARWYYWCDKLGLLVWQDMPSAMTRTPPTGVRKGAAEDAQFPPDAAASWERELRALVHNLANTPSVIAGCRSTRAGASTTTNDVLRLVKSLDPSRLVDAPSGWEDRGFGDLQGHAPVSRPRHVPRDAAIAFRFSANSAASGCPSKATCGGTSATGDTGPSKTALSSRPATRL